MSKSYKDLIAAKIEGNVKSFIDGHPALLDCVLWYKPGQDKKRTFINSISKRLINDLTSDATIARLRIALQDGLPVGAPEGGSAAAVLGEGGGATEDMPKPSPDAVYSVDQVIWNAAIEAAAQVIDNSRMTADEQKYIAAAIRNLKK